jgi:NDP-sugar pyrophosphorylase family protein
MSVVVVAVDERSDCGSVVVDNERTVVQFLEKTHTDSARYVNAGIYGLSTEMLFEIPAGRQISLAQQILAHAQVHIPQSGNNQLFPKCSDRTY